MREKGFLKKQKAHRARVMASPELFANKLLAKAYLRRV